MTEPIDGTAVEEPPVDAPPPAPHGPGAGMDLVPAARVTHEVLMPLDVAQQAHAMELYQQGLQSILKASDWQDAGRGERFVKKSGWRKIAAWFNLSIELVRDEVDRDEHGSPVRATVWARAVAPNGRHADGDGHCSADESRFQKEKGRQKLENDLRGTAATRATNRAISNLVGMGAVSAEEVDAGAAAAAVPAWATFLGDDDQAKQLKGQLLEHLQVLLGAERDTAVAAAQQLAQVLGGIPQFVPAWLGALAATAQALNGPPANPPADPPDAEQVPDPITSPEAAAAREAAADTTTTKKGKK